MEIVTVKGVPSVKIGRELGSRLHQWRHFLHIKIKGNFTVY